MPTPNDPDKYVNPNDDMNWRVPELSVEQKTEYGYQFAESPVRGDSVWNAKRPRLNPPPGGAFNESTSWNDLVTISILKSIVAFVPHIYRGRPPGIGGDIHSVLSSAPAMERAWQGVEMEMTSKQDFTRQDKVTAKADWLPLMTRYARDYVSNPALFPSDLNAAGRTQDSDLNTSPSEDDGGLGGFIGRTIFGPASPTLNPTRPRGTPAPVPAPANPANNDPEDSGPSPLPYANHRGSTNPPTSRPTPSPTNPPTAPPTQTPTETPTETPTQVPATGEKGYYETMTSNIKALFDNFREEKIKDKADNDLVESENRDRESDITGNLRVFLPIAGSSELDEQEDEASVQLKANNLLMGQYKPANWPLGNVDNPFWVSNLANEGMRYAPELFAMPEVLQGGTLTEGAKLYGSYRDAPTNTLRILAPPAQPGNSIHYAKRRRRMR
jgi:hypothetical protein